MSVLRCTLHTVCKHSYDYLPVFFYLKREMGERGRKERERENAHHLQYYRSTNVDLFLMHFWIVRYPHDGQRTSIMFPGTDRWMDNWIYVCVCIHALFLSPSSLFSHKIHEASTARRYVLTTLPCNAKHRLHGHQHDDKIPGTRICAGVDRGTRASVW